MSLIRFAAVVGSVNRLLATVALLFLVSCEPTQDQPADTFGEPDSSSNVSTETTTPLSAEAIAGSGGKLLYRGATYTDQVDVATNALVGVIASDGQTYLYHPSLGTNVELSAYNTRRAVGAFIEGLLDQLGNDSGAATTARKVLTISQAGTDICDNPSRNAFEQNIQTELGANLYAWQTQDSSGVSCRVTNSTKRWIAVKTATGDGPYFLGPASYGEWKSDFVGVLQQLASGRQHEEAQAEVTGAPIKMHASIARGGAVIQTLITDENLNNLVPERLRRLLGQWGPSSLGLSHDEAMAEVAKLGVKASLGYQDDPDLFTRVNLVELAYFACEGLKSLLGAIPEECSEAIFKALLANVGETLMIGAYSGEVSKYIEFGSATAEALVDAALQCGLEILTAGGSSIASNFLDLLGFLAWVNEWKLAENDVFNRPNLACADFYNPALTSVNEVGDAGLSLRTSQMIGEIADGQTIQIRGTKATTTNEVWGMPNYDYSDWYEFNVPQIGPAGIMTFSVTGAVKNVSVHVGLSGDPFATAEVGQVGEYCSGWVQERHFISVLEPTGNYTITLKYVVGLPPEWAQ